VSSDGGSFAYLGVHVGADWVVRCSTYTDSTPILGVDAGGLGIAMNISGKDSSRAVEFARALLQEARVFAAEVERIYGAEDGSKAAGEAA
jgi:hypothetical protein